MFLRSATRTEAGIIFEALGHDYALECAKHDPITVVSLDSSSSLQSSDPAGSVAATTALSLTHLKNEYRFIVNEITPRWKEDTSLYYQPESATLPGIDSFAFEVGNDGTIKGIVMFQFTISDQHPINCKFINVLWDAFSKMVEGGADEKDPKVLYPPRSELSTLLHVAWKLVFVVPADAVKSFHKQTFKKPAPKPIVEQYTWMVQTEGMWKTLRSAKLTVAEGNIAK